MSEELAAVTPARAGGTWGSALTADEFAAIRGAGFEPVGQVFGAAVYGVGSTGYRCPGNGRPDGDPAPPRRPATEVAGRNDPGSFGPLVQARYQARDLALDRMIRECRELGGHGVVGVRLSRGSFLAGGSQFMAVGTAVRAPGAAPGPEVPFTSGLSGQDFAKLVMTGWVPAGLVLGISIGSRHDDREIIRQTRWGSGNTEVAGWTELVNESRHAARGQLAADLARLGAEGVVIATMELRVRERDCPAQVGRRDHVVEATLTGTAIARFGPPEPGHSRPALTIMSLDPQRRRAARIRSLGSYAGRVEDLGSERYLSLTSFRRDGTPVATPVWVVAHGGRLYVWTGAQTGKVRRIRGNPAVTLAACTGRGTVTGPARPAQATIVAGRERSDVWAQFLAKYGVQLRAILLAERIARIVRRRPASPEDRVYLELTLAAA